MPSITEFFSSKFLKASDLQGQEVKVTISNVGKEQFENDGKPEIKPVLYFVNKDKGVVLNRTNSNAVSGAYGEDYTQWAGNQITLFPAMVDAWGETKEAIRIRVTADNMRAVNQNGTSADAAETPEEPVADVAVVDDADDDDSLPF